MDLQTFYELLSQPNARGYDLDIDDQKPVVEHAEGPLWLLAGPGSGKTEVLVTRALKLICVEGVHPGSIILTTFTKKAARNLEDRLASYFSVLRQADPALESVDLTDMRVGTIHSLCDDILHEFRSPNYRNVRLLDDIEQHLFVYRYADISRHQDTDFWCQFEHAVSGWHRNSAFPPNRWQAAKAAVTLFNHIVEDMVDIQMMRAAGRHWQTLADFYLQYESVLRENYRCDFAHLQARFFEFLSSPASHRFLNGEVQNQEALLHVLVDEYQDTNPIQERIYLALANRPPFNLTVVGDDDQALYRFRGGTVACMVNFDRACQAVFRVSPIQRQLRKNYRSHPQIVEFINNYITSFPHMNRPGVRAPNKEDEIPAVNITEEYPAVSWISRSQAKQLADAVADLIQNYLHAQPDPVLADLSQCVILMRSTKDSPNNAGPILDACARRAIPVYNPRSKSFMESEEVQCLLAALIHVIDLNFIWSGMSLRGLSDTVQEWINLLVQLSNQPGSNFGNLIAYVTQSNEELRRLCRLQPGEFLDTNLLAILYRILSLEPFSTWKTDPVRNMRLAKVTRLFESYHSMNLDVLIVNQSGTEIDQRFLERFYNMFIGYLIQTGIDDEEDDEVIVPRGMLPIMTVHQSKGLQFPFVIVLQVGNKGQIGTSQILEHDLAPFRQNLYMRNIQPLEEMVLEDDTRLLYVAYSRAQYALIIVGTPAQIQNHLAAPGRNFTNFRRTIPVI